MYVFFLGRYKLNKKGKTIKTIIIDGNEYRDNSARPISKRFEKKLQSFKKQTNTEQIKK